MSNMKQIAVFISGGGSNLQALIDEVHSNEAVNCKIALVLSNKADAYGLKRAEQAGIKTIVLEKYPKEKRSHYDKRLCDVISEQQQLADLDFVVMAGFLRKLSALFVDFMNARAIPIVNLHPALPGEYPGLNAIERAFADFEAGKLERSGVMLHYVDDEGVDVGPIVQKEEVALFATDTLETFAERMHACEHRLIVSTVKAIVDS